MATQCDNVSPDVMDCLCLLPKKPPIGRSYAPFVKLKIKDIEILCGNESYENGAPQHTMVIKSMHYGMSRGNGGITVEFEILSEGSEGYKLLFDKINKSIKEAEKDSKSSTFSFGWNNLSCDASLDPLKSGRLHILPIKMSTNISTGIAKIKLECKDLLERHNDRRVTTNIGEEGNLIPLKDAIEQLCRENDPPIDVEFRGADGGELEFEDNEKGYKSVWKASELPILSVIRNWVSTTRTKKEKGVYFKYSPKNETLIIQEDDECGPDENCGCENGVIASYIVNGGNCSPVLEFTTDIDWILDAGGYGGISGSASTSGIEKSDAPIELEPIEKSGSGNEQAIPSEYDYTISPEARAQKLKDATAANTKANKPFDTAKSISGELTIIGNPSYSDISDIGRYISIVVLSPYSISGNSGSGCFWIADTPINKTLSNKKWMLEGIDHQIEGGKYITKLKVGLPVPNGELPADSPLGGEGSCGVKTEGTGDGSFEGEDV